MRCSPLFLLSLFAAALPAVAADPALALLGARCKACHQGATPAGKVAFDTEAAARAVNPALLVAAISGEKPRMPKGGKPLTAAEVDILKAWAGKGEVWWSLRALPPAPAGGSIDTFVAAKLKSEGLTASPEADRRTLIRRLTYDLHGLPPTWEEVQAFVNDPAPDAYERLVDRLLASPRYGERWARHWLDTAHYAESHGYDKDKPRRHAWPYRDWVIAAFNNDKPFERFVTEQIAGDVLYPDEPQALVATGFLAAGPWDFVGHAELREGTTDKKITRLLDRDDMLMTVMSAFTSTTVHCARCHDHKFDPIPQEDYYKIQAVFAGVDRADRPYDQDPALHHRRQELLGQRRTVMVHLQPLLDEAAAVKTPAIEALDSEVSEGRRIQSAQKVADPALRQKIADAQARRKELVQQALPPATREATAKWTAELARLDKELAALPEPRYVYAPSNFFPLNGTFRWAPEPRPIHVLNRGSVDAPGKLVDPGALSVVKLPFPQGEDRRAALAHWIVNKENPLTWRSIVNRVWHYHFGQGLVDSPNDFGRMGSQPTHPELLDWLAARFRDSGGSFKQLHRAIVLSATYKQSSATQPENARKDGENRYLWRMNRARLDAESVRDSSLFVAGKLDLTMGGPSAEQFFFKDDHSPVYDYTRFDLDSPASFRRAVYRFTVRSVPDPLMDRLDCPDPSMMTAKRNVTLTAIQALALRNNPLLIRQAEHLAERLEREAPKDRTAQLRLLYHHALSREATSAELDLLRPYAARHGLVNACRVVLNSNEFLFLD